jgi:pimeloyl-ACP methyl ester carboxylesterase
MFRDLLLRLADRYHVVAPDYPGFGHSEFPDHSQFSCSFQAYTVLLDKFVQSIGLEKYALYVQDYGAPIGFRLALLHPDRVTALIIQNGNAYEEGLSDEWNPLRAYWKDRTHENRERLRNWLTPDGIRLQYAAGLPETLTPLLDPDSWTLDWALLARPGNIDMQLDLFGDYGRNVDLYPKFQEFFRIYQPPALIVWGRFDPFFAIAGAHAYLRDLPGAELHLLDAGHFALETHSAEIAGRMADFLGRHLGLVR